ncbi:MAG: alpha/beta hydrolase [Saprospiraceae bacterium]|nr:alpha/beta hydrolase [Saprospiraceae bacterium]
MESNKTDLSFFTEGDSNKKPIVFIHGFPYDHTMWDNLIDELKSHYYCVTYDIRGLGESPIGDGQYTMESFVDDLEMIIAELNLDKPILCGLSMGGYISLRAVERNESNYSGLILCDTRSSADADEGKIKRADNIRKINIHGVKQFVNDFVPLCFAVKSITDSNEEYSKVLRKSLSSNAIGVKGCLLAMAGRTDTTGYLSKIKIPALLLCGEDDRLTPPDVMEMMAAQIPGSHFEIVPGAGHMSPIENASFVTNKIKKFLSKIS